MQPLKTRIIQYNDVKLCWRYKSLFIEISAGSIKKILIKFAGIIVKKLSPISINANLEYY